MMDKGGLTKLIEECAEVIQVAAKAQALGTLGVHWDGTNLKDLLEDELADVMAATMFVAEKFNLNQGRMAARADGKLELYHTWDEERKE